MMKAWSNCFCHVRNIATFVGVCLRLLLSWLPRLDAWKWEVSWYNHFHRCFTYGLNCSIASVACCTSEESLQSFNLFSLNKETFSQQDSHYEIQRAVTKYHKLLRFSVVFILQKPRHFSEGDPPKGSGTKVWYCRY